MRVSLKSGAKLEGHKGIVKCLQLSEDGTICLTAGLDGTARLWDVGMKKCVKTIEGLSSPITAMSCCNDF